MAYGAGKHHHCEVVVVGAGPYGLAVGAHLREAGVDAIVFGEPMSFWRNSMPEGMKLRSPWRATHIADPNDNFTMDVYDTGRRMPRAYPVPLEEFVQYGEWFQRKAVPNLDRRKITSIDQADRGFIVSLEDGEVLHVRAVIVAMGLANQAFKPEEFAGLPAELVSHTCEHPSLRHFQGQSVAVVGRGQSACESAVLMKEIGAEVEMICRGDIHWLGGGAAPGRDKPMDRLRESITAPSAVGPFPLNWMVELPGVVHQFPDPLRSRFTSRSLRAAAAGWVLARFDGVKVNPGRTILGARRVTDRIQMQLDNGTASYDHVLLATGYRIDIAKLGILAPGLLRNVRREAGSPRLAKGFESSVSGLYFVGSSAVSSFGPLMRFIAGSGYAARSVTRSILAARAQVRRRSAAKVAPRPETISGEAVQQP
jgi:cation diffusion facilitator CzcD-associated flavoprotein CzcO